MASKLKRITHVEDDPDIRAIVKLLLTDVAGYKLDSCANGSEALARTAKFNPDLIILDVMMPVMDGVETFRRLRAIPKLADKPIIFMTAKAMNKEVQQYLSMGAAEVIAKPFDPMTLSARVRDSWQRACTRG